MKTLLLDENLPRPLKNYFSKDFSVTTVSDLGWQSKENGELLSAMVERGIEFLHTADVNIPYQQNLSRSNVRIVVLRTHDTRLKALTLHISSIERSISDAGNDSKLIEVDCR